MGDRRRVVVTGAAGLIGGEVLGALTGADFETIAVTWDGSAAVPLGAAKAVSLDLRRQESAGFLLALEPDAIVHAAAVVPQAHTGTEASVAGGENRIIDDLVLEVVASTGCFLVYVSSTSVYGCVSTRCTESSPIHPRGPYSEEKRRSEERVLGLGFTGTVLRVSAPYGRRQRNLTVLHKFIGQALRGDDLVYYGTGGREQNFTAVEDVSSAIVAALQVGVGGLFNIAGGEPITMRELAALVIQTVGSRGSQVRAAGIDDPEEDCRAQIAIEKAARELRWEPRIPLQVGIGALASSGGTRREVTSPAS